MIMYLRDLILYQLANHNRDMERAERELRDELAGTHTLRRFSRECAFIASALVCSVLCSVGARIYLYCVRVRMQRLFQRM